MARCSSSRRAFGEPWYCENNGTLEFIAKNPNRRWSGFAKPAAKVQPPQGPETEPTYRPNRITLSGGAA